MVGVSPERGDRQGNAGGGAHRQSLAGVETRGPAGAAGAPGSWGPPAGLYCQPHQNQLQVFFPFPPASSQINNTETYKFINYKL